MSILCQRKKDTTKESKDKGVEISPPDIYRCLSHMESSMWATNSSHRLYFDIPLRARRHSLCLVLASSSTEVFPSVGLNLSDVETMVVCVIQWVHLMAWRDVIQIVRASMYVFVALCAHWFYNVEVPKMSPQEWQGEELATLDSLFGSHWNQVKLKDYDWRWC